MNSRIPVAVSTDDNYAIPTYVMLHSLLKFANTDFTYDIYILIKKNLSDENNLLFDDLKKQYLNCELHYCLVGDIMSEVKVVLGHTTIETVYKCLIPDVLKEYTKCIYLDGDILINGDISEIYSYDIEEYYIGAIRDIEAQPYIEQFEYPDIVPPCDQYVNAGMMLMNLKKLRDDGISRKLIECSKYKLLFLDQDIFNICCHDHILFLPLKYNTMVKYKFVNYGFKTIPEHIATYFSMEEIREAYEHPVVIHYAQPIKPWQCKYSYQCDKWHKYIHKFVAPHIYRSYIKPYIRKQKSKPKVQTVNLVKYILRKIGIYKYFIKNKL